MRSCFLKAPEAHSYNDKVQVTIRGQDEPLEGEGEELMERLRGEIARSEDPLVVDILLPKNCVELKNFDSFWKTTVSNKLPPATCKHAWGEFTTGTMWKVRARPPRC